jgi:hypothetical protein
MRDRLFWASISVQPETVKFNEADSEDQCDVTT